MSVDFYNQNASSFIEGTIDADLQELYDMFLPMLTTGDHILDAGCGSGRDSKFFLDNGFSVTAIDASTELAKSASKLIGQDVEVCLFQNFSPKITFDAIWACASLLHVPSCELPSVFEKLTQSLKSDGYIYCSFKYGEDDVNRDGRYFTNANEGRLGSFIKGSPISVHKSWVTSDVRPGREHEKWLNAILVKGGN